MKSKSLYQILFFAVILIAVFALACGGSREKKSTDKYPAEATTNFNEAKTLLAETDVLPPFVSNGSLSSFDTSQSNSLLPSPDKLSQDNDGDGNPDYNKYEDAIGDINEAISLIGAARKADYTAGAAEKAYFHMILGYLYTINAASRLINSPLGKKVIAYDSKIGKYGIDLPKGSGGTTNFQALGSNFADAEKSAKQIINSLYVLIGRKYTMNFAGATVNGVVWPAAVVTVDSTLSARFPNTKADTLHTGTLTHKGTHNAVHHFTRAIEEGGTIFEGVQKYLEEVKSKIHEFDSSLAGQASGYGFAQE